MGPKRQKQPKLMRVRITYTVDVTQRFRRALRCYDGKPGYATRGEVKQHYAQNGSTIDDDVLSTLDGFERAAWR